jgi:hypothetical protein
VADTSIPHPLDMDRRTRSDLSGPVDSVPLGSFDTAGALSTATTDGVVALIPPLDVNLTTVPTFNYLTTPV